MVIFEILQITKKSAMTTAQQQVHTSPESQTSTNFGTNQCYLYWGKTNNIHFDSFKNSRKFEIIRDWEFVKLHLLFNKAEISSFCAEMKHLKWLEFFFKKDSKNNSLFSTYLLFKISLVYLAFCHFIMQAKKQGSRVLSKIIHLPSVKLFRSCFVLGMSLRNLITLALPNFKKFILLLGWMIKFKFRESTW